MLFALLALASAKNAPEAKPAAAPRPQIVGDSTQGCIMCKFYVSLISDLLQEGATIEEITQRIETLCTYVSESYQKFCDTLVEIGIPIIVEYVAQQLEPNKICQMIKLCKD